MKNKNNVEVLITSLEILNPKEKSEAALGLNPTFLWARFVLTDDQPNGNKQRIPKSEFPNLIRSGLYTPIKMKAGQIGESHEESYPIGVVTVLREEKKGDVNLIVGLAALWSEERPEDVATIAERYANKKPLDVSWEISHSSQKEDEDGISILEGTLLTGTTLVKIPAYGGRTFIDDLLYAGLNKGSNDENNEEDETLKEEKNFEELTASFEAKVSEAADLSHTLEALQTEVNTLKENQLTDELKTELKDLKTFKEEAEAALELEETRVELRKKFEEAGLEVDEDYFKENDKVLTTMKEPEIDFFIESLKAVQASDDSGEDSKKKKASLKVPKLSIESEEVEDFSGADLGKALYSHKYEKE